MQNEIEGKVFAVSGTLERNTKGDVQLKVELRGGIYKDSVTKATSFLVVGAKRAEAKVEKARSLGAVILDEAAFEELLARVPVTKDMVQRYRER